MWKSQSHDKTEGKHDDKKTYLRYSQHIYLSIFKDLTVQDYIITDPFDSPLRDSAKNSAVKFSIRIM